MPESDVEILREALAAVNEEAEKLLKFNLDDHVSRKIELIISISRYEMDVRSGFDRNE